VTTLERTIAEQLRINEELSVLRKDDNIIQERNNKDQTMRWLAMGLATLAGGTVIGLTAGLAAPLIGAGMTTALGALGVTGMYCIFIVRCCWNSYRCHWYGADHYGRCFGWRRSLGEINVEANKWADRI
jgi:hypothetical protein